MVKRIAMVGGLVVLTLTLVACAGTAEETAATTTTPGTIRESSLGNVPVRPAVTVTRPEEVVEVDPFDLPDELRFDPAVLFLGDEEGSCINAAIADYLEGPDASSDDEVLSGVLGSAILACSDQGEIASAITRRVLGDTPLMTAEQAACIENEIEGSDPEVLAVFLGAFTYGGSGIPELQTPFNASFTTACNLG